jgi:hypothetical protein
MGACQSSAGSANPTAGKDNPLCQEDGSFFEIVSFTGVVASSAPREAMRVAGCVHELVH